MPASRETTGLEASLAAGFASQAADQSGAPRVSAVASFSSVSSLIAGRRRADTAAEAAPKPVAVCAGDQPAEVVGCVLQGVGHVLGDLLFLFRSRPRPRYGNIPEEPASTTSLPQARDLPVDPLQLVSRRPTWPR
ncbi:MAG: hypothetical protein H6905_10070 [Hyphomicrobiales bacterium]|nr:hypothetical protein [Hyphomicrobiales bacterium]